MLPLGGVRARWGGVLPLSLVVAMLRGGTGLLRGWTGLQPLAAPWQRAFATRSASHVKHSEKKTKLPVILLQNCELGRKGDEVHVSPGYMRNYLYGRRIAVYSTPENKREHHVQRTVRDRTAFLRPAKMAASLSGTPLVMYRHVEPGEQRPRNEVTAENIAEKLAKHRSIDLAPEQLQLEAPIAELGEHLVQVELGRGYSASLVVAVEPR